MRSIVPIIAALMAMAVCRVATANQSSDFASQSGQYTHQRDKNNKPWAEVVGRRVQADGLAWGEFDKGWGPYVILEGARIHVRDAEFFKNGAEGKLVRVQGVLRSRKIEAAPPGAQGAARAFILYEIVSPAWRAIDRVEWPWLQVIDR